MKWYVGLAFVFVLACSQEEKLASYDSKPAGVALMTQEVGNVAADKRAESSSSDESSQFKNPTATQLPESAIAPSLIIRNAEASVEVDKIDSAIASVRKLAESAGGYVANSNLFSGENQVKSATLELKIPSSNFEKVISGLKPVGKVETVNTTAEDVTEEYVDIAARITNAKRLEARLINLLAERTGKLQDVLDVERELARVREDIERYEGRVRYLRTRAAISTIVVNLHEPRSVLGNAPGQSMIGESFKSAWRNFVGFIAAFISSLGVIVPLAVLGYFVWLGYKRWFRKGRKI